MTALAGLEPQYDAFLFASICETDDVTLSVLSMLARQDVDPWQEAARLTQLSKQPAISSLASMISRSNSESLSPSEANIQAVRLIELLPSHSRSAPNPQWNEDGNGAATLWLIVGALFVSIAISGTGKKMTSSSGAPTQSVAVQEQAMPQSPREIVAD